jgi:hypothetical protein
METIFGFNSAYFAGETKISERDLPKAFELLSDDRRFEFALVSNINMLEVAATASTWTGVRTWRNNAML